MPRRKRLYLPGFPYHFVLRGNIREACFVEPDNYQNYLELWESVCDRSFLNLANPISPINPEPNNQIAAGTETTVSPMVPVESIP